ncbi:MAG: sel1 repeat family protein [Deltaproteobacteria bacterium]|nr:sel1 repeat family protein [Deltaproteobacteria bacterium]
MTIASSGEQGAKTRFTDQDEGTVPNSNSDVDAAGADTVRFTDAYNDLILIKDGELSPLLKKTLENYFQDAEKGDASAQLLAGVACLSGVSVPKDAAKAFKWFGLSARQGHAIAQYHLGKAYAQGVGGPKNAKKGVKWLRLASEREYPPAQLALGQILRDGVDAPQDLAEAKRLFRLAAERGEPMAQFQLSQTLRKESPTPQNRV